MESLALVRVWNGAIALLVAVTLIVQLFVLDGGSVVNLFSYFTIQSNVLVMVGCGLVAASPTDDRAWVRWVRLAGLAGITVTGIVYATILAGSITLEGVHVVINLVFHYVVPWATVLGYVALRPRTRFDAWTWWVLAWPILWLVYTLVRAEVADPVFPLGDAVTGPVPYGFLDVDANGAGSVAVACLGVTALFVALVAGYQWVSRRPAR